MVATFNAPETVEAPKTSALVSMSATLLLLVTPTVLKLLPGLLRVMLLAAPAVSVVTPVTVKAPLWVSAPLVVTFNVPLTAEAARSSALLSTSVTLLPVAIPTVLKLLPALLRVMLLAAPAASVVVPVTVSGPDCVTAPAVVTFKVPEMVEGPRTRALISFRTTAFPLVTETAPVKLFALLSVMLFAPAVKVVVPGTTRLPMSVMAPPAATVRLPPAVSVAAGNVTGALSNCRVRFLRLVRVFNVGTVAPAFTLRIETSRNLERVPAKASAPPKLFAWLPRRISVLATEAVNEVVPATLRAPDWLSAPPVVRARLPLTVEAPRTSAFVSRRLTLLPLVMPMVLKLLADVARLMLLPTPAARVVAPVTFRMPL